MNALIERARGLWERKFIRDTLALQISKIAVAGLSALSALLTFRLLGPAGFGVYGLAQSFLGLFSALDFTGAGVMTTTRLGIAIGERNSDEIVNLLGYYVKITLAFNLLLTALLAIIGPSLALQIQGNALIGVLAALLALGGVGDALYTMVVIALQTRRSMRALALMQVSNQAILTVCMISAVLINPTAESLIVARLVYSFSTMTLAFIVYWRLRAVGTPEFPPLLTVFKRAWTVSPRGYWRWGVSNAVDRSLAQFFTQIPMQIAGIFGGPAAAGYLDLAISGIAQTSLFTSAVFDNMQAVVPQAVGRRDYARLWRNFARVTLIMGLGGLAFYGAVALASPLLVRVVVGDEWLPAVPALVALMPYGALALVGGLFAPVYRAFLLVRWVIVAKIGVLVIGLPLGYAITAALTQNLAEADASQAGALGSAITISLLFAASVGATALISLPALRQRAREDTQGQ